jgi:hypothetical protein
MDSLIEASLNAAALRPDDPHCVRHPDRKGVTMLYGGENFERIYYCKECSDAMPNTYRRAYGTGVGPQAHAEAQEAGRMDKEYQDLKPHAKVRKYHD